MAIDSISLTFESTSDSGGGEIWYVRLGALLQHIEKSIMYHAKVSTQSDSTPILKFDYDVDSNLMYIEKDFQTSIDPTICVLNRGIPVGENIYNVTKGAGDPFDSPLFPDLPATYGQIMNIYVSMSWVLLKMDEIKDAKTNKVVLIDMLNNILSGINSSLGGTVSLETTIDETTNTVIIRDANPLPNVSLVIAKLNANNPSLKISDKFAQFDLYGYNTELGSASFIKDFSLKTEISPELSMMITTGATANSTVVGENSTAFSKFNAGLTDRFKTEMVEGLTSILTPPVSAEAAGINFGVDPNSALGQALNKPARISQADSQAAADAELKATRDKYTSTLTKYYGYIRRLSESPSSFTKDEAETYKDVLTNIITYQQQYRQAVHNKVNSGKSLFAPSTGFIPFNMSLTMDGLSGMKIYSKFNIDTKFLPANYPDNAEFLIKNIQHKIENNKWFTIIESIVISKGGTDSLVYNKNKATLQQNSPQPKEKPIAQSNGTCVEPYTDKNLNKGWVGKKVPFVRTIVDPKIEGPKLTAKYGKVLAQAILATIKIEQNYRGFNWNLGGFDITSGGWEFNPKYHNGYVVAREGGTKKCKAFVSFISFETFVEQKAKSFIGKGFNQATNADAYAKLWYEKWNGFGARTVNPKNLTVAQLDANALASARKAWYDNKNYV